MVLDKLTNLKAYSKLIPKTDEILAAIEKVRAGEFTGSRLDIDGDSIFLLNQEYETFDREGRQLEAHRKYIDRQAVIKGEEYIGWSELEGLTLASEEYSKGGDIAFYNEEPKIYIPMTEGAFALFFPQDAHMPCIKMGDSRKVQKVVVKIAVDLA